MRAFAGSGAVVVQKRHHTRLFPTDRRAADRSGNVQPGGQDMKKFINWIDLHEPVVPPSEQSHVLCRMQSSEPCNNK